MNRVRCKVKLTLLATLGLIIVHSIYMKQLVPGCQLPPLMRMLEHKIGVVIVRFSPYPVKNRTPCIKTILIVMADTLKQRISRLLQYALSFSGCSGTATSHRVTTLRESNHHKTCDLRPKISFSWPQEAC